MTFLKDYVNTLDSYIKILERREKNEWSQRRGKPKKTDNNHIIYFKFLFKKGDLII